MSFSVSPMILSMDNPDTGNRLTANLYTVEGISRKLSMSELVMSICLQKAVSFEDEIVAKMNTMARTTVNLETLTAVQNAIVNQNIETFDKLNFATIKTAIKDLIYYKDDGSEYALSNITSNQGLFEFLRDTAGCSALKSITYNTATCVAVVQGVSSRMDTLNSVSQKDMISLQSMTNKRDQSYDLITNMLKSIGTVINNNLGNFCK